MRNIFEYNNNFIKYASVKSHLQWGDINSVLEPEVSIIIPCYKRPDYLEQALESAINQDYMGSYEVIVCDNTPLCEVSPNLELINKFKNNKILFYRNEENIGMYGNWNRLIELARAPYVVFLHDDDLLLPNALTILMSIQNKTNADGVNAAHNDIDGDGVIIRSAPLLPNKRKLLLFEYQINTRVTLFDLFMGCKGGFGCGCLFRKDALIKIGGFSEEFYPSADYALNSVMAKDFKLYYTNIPTFSYRIAANESYSAYTKFAELDKHFRICMKKYIPLPNIFLNFLIHALYRTQSIYFRITWEGDDGTLKKQLRKDDLLLCRLTNIFRTLINDYSF